jgi:hypothetical protein
MQARLQLGFCPMPGCGEKVKIKHLVVQLKAKQGVSLEVVEYPKRMTGVICPKHGRFRLPFTPKSSVVAEAKALKDFVEREEEKEAIQEDDLKSKGLS